MTAALDHVLPAYRHRERHTTRIATTPDAVWSALHEVSNGDLRLTHVLMKIRAIPARLPGGGSPLRNAPGDRGFIEAFLERGWREMRVDPPWTLLMGAVGQPWRLRGGETPDVIDLDGFRAFARPGFVLMATSFELEPLGHGTRLSTETRVQPTDAAAARTFRPYWWAIRGGSGLIRRDVLHTVRHQAEPTRPQQQLRHIAPDHDWPDSPERHGKLRASGLTLIATRTPSTPRPSWSSCAPKGS